MSVAAPTSTETKAASQPASLWTTGFVGGVYVLAALAVVFFGVPQLWKIGVGSAISSTFNTAIDWALFVLVQVAAAVGLVVFGMSLAGPHPPKGCRGSIFLGISSIFTGFFLLRALVMIAMRLGAKFEAGQMVALIFVSACIFFFYKFLSSDRFPRWSLALEEAGWLDASSYKRAQGSRVRRLTILGVIVLFGSGVYTMWHNNVVPVGNWSIWIPMVDRNLILLPAAHLTLPLLLGALTIWLAWRVVNYPVFADFLIATEAEINKVSWTPRARLIQDTIVVLITVFIITLFLFIVDIFWGWILSRDIVGVIPNPKKDKTEQVGKTDY
jgi:preprotein translocase SecE subunit